MTLEKQFYDDLASWEEDSAQPGMWFRPRCACIEFARERLAAGNFSEPALKQAWDNFKACDHGAIVAKWLTPADLAESQMPAESLNTARTRCSQMIRGLIATIDAASLIVGKGWGAGLSLPDEIRDCLANALEAYQQAWGLAPGGKLVTMLPRNLRGAGGTAFEAMIEVVNNQGIDEETAPAWLTVHRLLDYLLTGPAASSAPVAAALASRDAGSPVPPRPQPGSTANPVLARILLARRGKPGGKPVGELRDLLAMRQDVGPASWYLDPVQLGLTVCQPDFIDSLRLAWRACRAEQPASAAIRLAPALVDCKIVSGPSGGAMAACAMYAALVGEQLNSDASASAALTLCSGRSLDDGQPIRLEDIALGNVGFIKEKLGAALRGRQTSLRLGPLAAPLRKVVLTADQAQDAIEARWHQPLSGPAIAVHGAANLGEVYAHLTGDARIERALEAYCLEKAKEWDESWTGHNDFSKQTDLIYYVPPHYALLKDGDARRVGKSIRPRPEEEGVAFAAYDYFRQESEDDNLVALLKAAGLRFCLDDAPGAGKTIFTRRLLGFLSSSEGRAALLEGQPGLALRWEEAKKNWPEHLDGFDGELAEAITPFCAAYEVVPKEVVEYAWKHGRVTLILDALDQANDDQVEVFRRLLHRLDERRVTCRIVLTGRPYAVELYRGDSASLLPLPTWRFGKIEPFTPWQQYLYLRGPTPGSPEAPDAWRRRAITPDTIVQPLVDEVMAGSDPEPVIEKFWPPYPTAPDLFGNPQNLQMVRELAEFGHMEALRYRTDLYQEISRRRIECDYVRHHRKPDDKIQYLLERLLAAAAFQMLVDHPRQHRVDGEDVIRRLKLNAGRRLDPPATDNDWKLLEAVTALTNRTLLLAANSKTFAWPDPRMLEFFAGLHLASNQQPNWADSVNDPQALIRCGETAVRLNAARPEWHEVWKHALLIWPERRQHSVLLASVAELFQPVTQPTVSQGKKSWLRPTELMYRAWCLLDEGLPAHERAQPSPEPLKDGGRVLAAFREQFQRQLSEPGEVGRIARDLNGDFVTVPPLEDGTLALTKPHRISLKSFQLGRTAVTREQYGLFDRGYASVNAELLNGYEVQSPRCPAGNLTWYDAWCAARYLGSLLPTEAQWEYACGAGSREAFCRIATTTSPGYQDLAHDADLRLVADYGRDWGAGPREVAQLRPNYFGLYDMHGGVWEWCVSWYGEFSLTELASPVDGSHRVNRGGSWCGMADGCRTAARDWDDPSDRGATRGFRLARVR